MTITTYIPYIPYIPIVLSGLFAICTLIKAKRTPEKVNPFYLQVLPTLLTSSGVLGTFIGIYIGLYSFNVQDIEGSITELLGGLKGAFITSILGIT